DRVCQHLYSRKTLIHRDPSPLECRFNRERIADWKCQILSSFTHHSAAGFQLFTPSRMKQMKGLRESRHFRAMSAREHHFVLPPHNQVSDRIPLEANFTAAFIPRFPLKI